MPAQDRHSRGRTGRDSPGDSRSPHISKDVPAKVARIEGRTSAVAVAAAGQPATLLMPRRGSGHAQEEFEEIIEPADDADMGGATPGTPVVDLSLEENQGKGQGKVKD